MKTKVILEKIGSIFFITLFVGLPFVLFNFYYKGDPVGNWFDNIQWYEVGFRIFIITLSILVYCLFMFGVKFTVFEPLWAKLSTWYDSKCEPEGIKGSREVSNNDDVDNTTHR